VTKKVKGLEFNYLGGELTLHNGNKIPLKNAAGLYKDFFNAI